jgi:hypothetical protein
VLERDAVPWRGRASRGAPSGAPSQDGGGDSLHPRVEAEAARGGRAGEGAAWKGCAATMKPLFAAVVIVSRLRLSATGRRRWNLSTVVSWRSTKDLSQDR